MLHPVAGPSVIKRKMQKWSREAKGIENVYEPGSSGQGATGDSRPGFKLEDAFRGSMWRDYHGGQEHSSLFLRIKIKRRGKKG